jgi:hypothetical protein
MTAIFQQLFSECPLVDQATEDSDASTAGYIYNEIIRTQSHFTFPECLPP